MDDVASETLNSNGAGLADPLPANTLGRVTLFKAASTVSLLTLVSRITGLMREVLMASTFGASAMTDAFNVAFRIPNLFRRLFAEGAFSAAFVPVLATTRSQQGDEVTRLLIDRVASLLIAVLLLTCVLGVAGAPVLVWLLASGLQQDAKAYDAAVLMARWMFPYIGFMSLVAFSAGILNTWRRYAVPAASPVLLNLALIVAAWAGAPWFKTLGIEPIYAMACGVIVGGLLQLAVQLPALRRAGLLPAPSFVWRALLEAWSDDKVRRIARLMLPALLGVSVAQLSLLINTQIASYLAPGSVSWLAYADRLMEFPTALLGVALGVVLTPQLAAAESSGDSARYSAMLDWGLRLVVLLSLPCALALLLFSRPLISVLLHYGAFTDHDLQQTSLALVGYGVGLVGLVAIKVLAPAYYARQDIRTPVRIAIIVLILTQVLNLFAVPRLQHAGLALTIGLGALVNAGWLLAGLLRDGRFKPQPGWGRFLLQVAFANLLLALFLGWANAAFDWTAMRQQSLERIGLLSAVMLASIGGYLLLTSLAGLRWRDLLKP